LPSRDPKKKALKKAIVPPEGYVVINCDSSQIEARVLPWLAGQDDIVKLFADGEDVYSVFASAVYERPITKKNPVERFVGKTCILGLGYGTGALKLQHTLATTPPGVKLTEDECKGLVTKYRQLNDKIIDLWAEGDQMLDEMMRGQQEPLVWLKGKLGGSYTDQQLKSLGARLINGNWAMPKTKYNELIKSGRLRETENDDPVDEDYSPDDPPGPETPPEFPAGTVKVDVSDVYDWYKLGQHISDLDGLGHHDFGQGPPSTVLAFGSEDQEEKYIKNLKKLGLKTHDIDPPGLKGDIDEAKLFAEYQQFLEGASGYIPSNAEKNDPRFKTALTVDVKPDTLKKSAKKMGFNISRAGIPPLLRK
jgi:hypothetical protein